MQILEQGPRNAVVKSTAAETISSSSFTPVPTALAINKIIYDVGAATDVQVQWDTTVSFAVPVLTSVTTSGTGGTLAAGTYYYVVTALFAAGESTRSNELSVVTTGTTSSNTVTWTAVSGATGYRVYRGTSAGGENTYFAVGAVTSFVDTGGAGTAGTPPATSTLINTVATILSGRETMDYKDFGGLYPDSAGGIITNVNVKIVGTGTFTIILYLKKA